jgi:hypothetical protein
MHHVAQRIFVLVVGVDIDHVEMRIGKALDALDRALADDLHIGRAGKPLRDVLEVLLLVRIGIIAVMLPVHPPCKIGEVLGVVLERVVLLDVELPVIDEVVPGGRAGIENDLRKIALVDAHFRPHRVARDQADQSVAIGHHEIHERKSPHDGSIDRSKAISAPQPKAGRAAGSFSASLIDRVTTC